MGLPSVLHNYHSLVPVDLPVNQLSRVYGYPNHVYRATSSRDGNVYCLRRVEGQSDCLAVLSMISIMVAGSSDLGGKVMT